MQKHGKAFLLTSGIIEIIYASIIIIASIAMIAISFAAGSITGLDELGLGSIGTSIMVAIGLLALAIGILFLVFGIISTKTANSQPEKYYTSKGKILAFAIVETVLLLLSILGSIPQKGATLTTISLISTIVVCVILALIVAFKYTTYGLMVKHAKTND